MAKGRSSNDASATITQAQQNSDTNTGNANALYSDLAPTLESQVANPQGYSPVDEAAMETGAQQGAGGGEAAAVGQGGLLAARTGNAGAAGKSISDASRGSGEQLSKNLLGIRSADANLKQEQRGQALTGLENLETGQESSATSNLGQVAPLVVANADEKNASLAKGQGEFNDVLNSLKYLSNPTGAQQ